MSPPPTTTPTSSLRVPAAGGVAYIGSPPPGGDVVAFDDLAAGYCDVVPGSNPARQLPPAMRQVNIHEAKIQLSGSVKIAAAGEKVVVAQSGISIPRLEPLARESAPAGRCLFKGRMKIGAEFGLQLATYGDTILIV